MGCLLCLGFAESFDGVQQVRLVAIAPITVAAEGYVARGELGHVEDGADLATAIGAFGLEQGDGEGRPADAVAVMGDGDDLELHKSNPFGWVGGYECMSRNTR